MKSPRVEIVVINWNSREQTLECLERVEQQLGEVAGSAVTVVDNGSRDGSATAFASKHPAAKLFALQENRGFTGAIHAALAASSAELIVFLNNDAVPEPGWLSALVRAIDTAPADVVAVGGRIIDLSGALIDFIGGMITFDGHAFQNGFRYPVGNRPEPASGSELLFACGGNMIVRRDVFEKLGGFDDDYFAYLEDVDFGWRSWAAGYRAIYAPDALVRHASGATSGRLGNFERGVLFERNALQTAIKNFDDANWREAAGAIFFTYLRRLHQYATTRNPRAGELTREAFAPGRPNASGVLSRLRHKLTGKPPLAAVDDPLTAMQMRAFDWLVRNEQHVMKKREAVQAMRVRSDREIFEKFPIHYVPTYPGDEQLFSGAIFRSLRLSLASADKKLGDIMRA